VNPKGGYTILELVLALGIVSFIFTLTLPLVQVQKVQWERQEALRQELRMLTAAMSRLTREIQCAGYHGGGPPVKSIESGSISYEISRDGRAADGLSVGNRRLVTVSLKGADLMYRVQSWDESSSLWRRGSTQALASGLAGACFRGLDRSGEGGVEAGETTAVEITLRGRRCGTLRTVAALRMARKGL